MKNTKDNAAKKLLTKSNIQAYLQRDWKALETVAEQSWKERIVIHGNAEGLRVADELWQQARLFHPSWPDPETRQKDLEHHVRLSRIFRRIQQTWRRTSS